MKVGWDEANMSERRCMSPMQKAQPKMKMKMKNIPLTQPSPNIVAQNHYVCLSKKRKQEESLTLKRSNHYRHRFHPTFHYHLRNWSLSPFHSSSFLGKFVLISYNILGVQIASQHRDLYFKVPFKYMKWDHRRAAICKELAQYDPSIMCFQEVDRFSSLHHALKQYGFEGIFKARTGDTSDGCAIFWKCQRFKLLHEDYIEFQSFGLRNNVAQFCVLKMIDDQLISDPKKSKQTCLVVGNIHILFNPKRGDIKLGQIRLFLEKAHKISEEWGGIPVVLAGDFNSVPQSALYQYISSAKLNVIQHDRKNISGQVENTQYHRFFNEPFRNLNGSEEEMKFGWNEEELKIATGNEKVSCLQHSLRLQSAYLGVPGNFTTRDNIGEPLVTSYHSKFFGTVDYIWHSEQLVPLRVLETLSKNTLENMGGLPSKDWGSDHLALACEFAFANSDFNTRSKRSPNTGYES